MTFQSFESGEFNGDLRDICFIDKDYVQNYFNIECQVGFFIYLLLILLLPFGTAGFILLTMFMNNFVINFVPNASFENPLLSFIIPL